MLAVKNLEAAYAGALAGGSDQRRQRSRGNPYHISSLTPNKTSLASRQLASLRCTRTGFRCTASPTMHGHVGLSEVILTSVASAPRNLMMPTSRNRSQPTPGGGSATNTRRGPAWDLRTHSFLLD